jgi:hypothetical protein
VPIGDTLTEARQRAGLTVAQVSEQTCIKVAVITGIEGNDYSVCGGDFYARANIRSIAKAVGADSGPLIAEYDALYRARGVLPAVSLDELLATSVPARQRSWPGWSAVGGLVPSGNDPAHRPRGRWLYWAVVLGLVVVLGFGVYSRLLGPRRAAAAPPAGGRHAVTHQPPGAGGPRPAPKLTHAAATPTPAPRLTRAAVEPGPAPGLTHAAAAPAPATAAPARTLTPAGAGAPHPGGGSAPPPARRAIGGSRAAGPAHQATRHDPLPERVLVHQPAHEQSRPSHDDGRRDRHPRRTPAAQQDGRQYGSPDGHA